MEIESSKTKPVAKRKPNQTKPKHQPSSVGEHKAGERVSSLVDRQAVIAQKIEALLELAKQADPSAVRLSAHTETAEQQDAGEPKATTPSHSPPRLEELERSLDYLLSLVQPRVRAKSKT